MEAEKTSAPIDITGDGGVMKEIMQEGVGEESPVEEQEVDLNYIGTFLDGTEFVREESHDEPIQVFIGKNKKCHKISFFLKNYINYNE